MTRKNYSKTLALLLCSTLSLGLLAGCGSTVDNTVSSAPVTEENTSVETPVNNEIVETVSNPNMIIHNGQVLTATDASVDATAVVIENDTIVFVGSDEDALKYKNDLSTVIDADGNSIMPSMADSHLHFATALSAKYEINIADVIDIEEIQAIIAEFIEANPDMDSYNGSGWMQSSFDVNIGPTANILDEVCPDKPLVLQNVDGHGYWANTKALEYVESILEAGVDGVVGNSVAEYNEHARENGGRIVVDENGKPSGWLKESASNLIADFNKDYTIEQCKTAILEQQEWFLSMGYTDFFDAGTFLSEVSTENYYSALKELAEAGELKIKVHSAFWVQPYDFHILDADGNYDAQASSEALAKYLNEWKERADQLNTTEYFKLNTIKFMADQVLEGGTAYLSDGMYSEEYVNEALKGTNETNNIWADKDDLMIQAFEFGAQNGMNLHVHTIGDNAVSLFLDNLEKIVDKYPEMKDNRVAMAHCQFVTEEDKQRMADLGVAAIVSPYWSCMDDYYWDVYLPIMSSQEVLDLQYPMQSLLDHNINIAFHSDYFVTAPDTGWQFYTAMTRTMPMKVYEMWYEGWEEYYLRNTDPNASYNIEDYDEDVMPILPLREHSERLTLEQAVKAATINGMKTLNLDQECGTIEVGKKANILVLNMDLEQTSTNDIESVQDVNPVYTIFEGEIVFSDAE